MLMMCVSQVVEDHSAGAFQKRLEEYSQMEKELKM